MSIAQPDSGAVTPQSRSFLLVHGLNISPRAMDWIGLELRARGHNTPLVQLSGHDGEFSHRTLASAARWKNDLALAAEKAKDFPRPLTILGYSLGGLLSALAVKKGIIAPPDKLVLLSPAIGLRSWVRFFEPLTKILPQSLPLPSGVPARYRAARFAAVSWYRALFDIYHELHADPGPGALKDLPIEIVVSEGDEFIGVAELRRWVAEASLSNVTFRFIRSKARLSPTPQHLLLEPEHFGEPEWGDWMMALTNPHT